MRVGTDARQIVRDRPDVRRDRHPVVVEHHEQVASGLSGVVHRLVGQAAGHRPVADHGDDPVILAGQVARRRQADRRGDRRGGVARTEGIELALVTLEEARDPPVLSYRPQPVPTTGQDLVHVGLMARVPDDAVARQIEDRLESHGQLDDAQAGAEVTSLLRHDLDHELADLVAQALEFLA